MISGKIATGRRAPMDLGDVVDAAVETILPAATAKDIGIRVPTSTPASRDDDGRWRHDCNKSCGTSCRTP